MLSGNVAKSERGEISAEKRRGRRNNVDGFLAWLGVSNWKKEEKEKERSSWPQSQIVRAGKNARIEGTLVLEAVRVIRIY